MPQPRVRFIGSRELHRDLPKVLDSLEDTDARFVLTIHSKPKAVLIGAEAFLALLRGHSSADRLLALQLGALVQGLEAANNSGRSGRGCGRRPGRTGRGLSHFRAIPSPNARPLTRPPGTLSRRERAEGATGELSQADRSAGSSPAGRRAGRLSRVSARDRPKTE